MKPTNELNTGNQRDQILYRIAFQDGENNGLDFFYAHNEDDAVKQYRQSRENIICSVTIMPGGFTSGGYSSGERVHLPSKPLSAI